MRKIHFLQFAATAIALCLFTMGCEKSQSQTTHTSFDAATAKKEIDAANQRLLELSLKTDSIGIADCFTADAKFMIANMPVVVGRKNIQTAISEMFKSGVSKVEITASEVWSAGEFIIESGETKYSSKDGAPLGKDKYITIWKQENGVWKIFRDCSNSDLAAPTMPAK